MLFRVAKGIGLSLLNGALFAACCFLALRSGLGLLGVAAVIMCSFGVLAALARMWSPGLLTVVVPAGIAFIATSAVLKRAIHIADEGSAQLAYPFWRYVVDTSVPEVIALGVATGVAAFGWSVSCVGKAKRSAGAGS
jgi:hypothetical protein